MKITLLRKWERYKKGAVLYVLRPRVDALTRPQLRRKKCSGQVDIGRAQAMVDKGLAAYGLIQRKGKSNG